jgi:hypothetical protein
VRKWWFVPIVLMSIACTIAQVPKNSRFWRNDERLYFLKRLDDLPGPRSGTSIGRKKQGQDQSLSVIWSKRPPRVVVVEGRLGLCRYPRLSAGKGPPMPRRFVRDMPPPSNAGTEVWPGLGFVCSGMPCGVPLMTISKPVFDRLGFSLWIGAFLVVLAMVLWSPHTRTVWKAYIGGSEALLAGLPLYDTQSEMGYLYAPAFAALYIPIVKLGPHLGGVVWHTLGFAVLTYAAMRQVRKLGGGELTWLLSFGLFLALPMALGAIRNGQATILLTGACWLLTLSALEGRRAETFFWASLAIIAKPTAIIMLLLVGALRLRLIPVLVLAVLFVLALPYAFAPAGYLNDQYRVFARMLTSMAVDNTSPFRCVRLHGAFYDGRAAHSGIRCHDRAHGHGPAYAFSRHLVRPQA